MIITESDWARDSIATKALKKTRRIWRATVLIIIAFTVAIIAFAFYETDNANQSHTRYILSSDTYRCTEIIDETGQNKTPVVEFEFVWKELLFSI